MQHKLITALALISLTSCDLWTQARPVRLPPTGERIALREAALRIYRYPIHGMNPVALAKIDAFHRGMDDVLVANSGSSTVTLFRNLGNGSFVDFGTWETCSSPTAVDGEDINGDGYADILVTCPSVSTLSLLTGDGRGGFQRRDISVGAHPILAQVAPHLAVAGTPYLSVLSDAPAALELLVRQRNNSFIQGRQLATPESPSGFVADVFTKDGSISYAVTSQSQSKLSIFLNDHGTFVRSDYEAPESASQLAGFDLRGQGRVDLVVASSTRNTFRVYLNDGDGQFGRTRDYVLSHGPASGIGSSHIRGLSQPEVYFQSALTGEVMVYPNIGDGTLGEPEIFQVGAALTGMITGRFAHQANDMDVAMIDSARGQLVILLNEHPDYQ